MAPVFLSNCIAHFCQAVQETTRAISGWKEVLVGKEQTEGSVQAAASDSHRPNASFWSDLFQFETICVRNPSKSIHECCNASQIKRFAWASNSSNPIWTLTVGPSILPDEAGIQKYRRCWLKGHLYWAYFPLSNGDLVEGSMLHICRGSLYLTDLGKNKSILNTDRHLRKS